MIDESVLRPIFDAPGDSPPIIAFSNNAYREITENWLQAMRLLEVPNVWVLSVDEAIHGWLKGQGVNTVLLNCDEALSSLWQLRIEIFRALVSNDVDFIHSDVDAVWLKNPLDRYYWQQPTFDIVVSQGTVWPPDVFERWQFVLCCGFFVMRANERTRRLLQRMTASVAATGDDQISLNRLVLEDRPEVFAGGRQYLNFRDVIILTSNEMMTVRSAKLALAVIPFAEVPRFHLDGARPYVEHPLSPKKAKEKKEQFIELGLWVI